MKFMGSKNRIAKYILPIMLKERQESQWWVEPFVGGGNMIDKVKGRRIGGDVDRYVIEALTTIRDHLDEIPQKRGDFTEQDYKALRKSDDYKFKGYAGFAFSYGGKWLGGWRRDSIGRRDYVAEAYKNAEKQSPFLQGVLFRCCSYEKLFLPQNTIIYCDPPYARSTRYKGRFNYTHFWQWCREMAGTGHKVYVSGYQAPKDFKVLWEKEIVSSLTKDTGSKRGIEKLFTLKETT